MVDCPGRCRTGVLRQALSLAAAACLALPACISSPLQAQAPNNRFDLTGPKIDIHVQRGDRSLPIALVPNLMAGDKLTIHAALPDTQSVHLILVIAFLRGSTNPPPDNWFTLVKTWDRKIRTEGVNVTVPAEAQEALMFLAPETGGDYSTLKSAVTGRPGIFVRAAQDLNEASFEQARIERYLHLIRQVPAGSPDELADHSKKLAATLNLKPNDACFKQPADQQLSCLRQSGTQLLLDDGHGQTLAAMLTSGDSANLIGAAAGTPMFNSNGLTYSAYVGTVIDLVHLMAGLHSAQFQYIPAIAFPSDETLNLRLNTAPSFRNPKSVIVVALPAIQQSVPPPLRLQDSAHVSCLLEPAMVLPLKGAPLVFATSFAHDLVLHLNNGPVNGQTDIPLTPNAFEGGLIVTGNTPEDRKPLPATAPEARDSSDNPLGVSAAVANQSTHADAGRAAAAKPATTPAVAAAPATTPPKPSGDGSGGGSGDLQITGTLHGMWGFDAFEGITVPLQRRDGTGWTVAPHTELIAGKVNQIALHAEGTACASKIELDLPGVHDLKLDWKQAPGENPDARRPLNVKLPLEKANPGSVQLLVHQFGTEDVSKVTVTAYSDATRVEALHIHAGDSFGTLTGSTLSGVKSVRIGETEYKPSPDQAPGDKELRLAGPPLTKAANGKGILSTAGETGNAEVLLADGRTLPIHYAVDGARPALALLSKQAKPDPSTGLPLNHTSKDDLPLNSRITFALRSESPQRFGRSEKIEVALTDGSLKTHLALGDGTLVLQDAKTALGFFSPAKAFGPSAFGPLQLRAVAEDGTAGDWIPVGTLVRTPSITGISCTRPAPGKPSAAAPMPAPPTDPGAAPAPDNSGCQITGADLFLVDSVSADNSFGAPEAIPLGFTGDSLPVPHPADNRTLYLKLRDDPDAVFTVSSISPLLPTGHHAAPAPAATPAPPAAAEVSPPAPLPAAATPPDTSAVPPQ